MQHDVRKHRRSVSIWLWTGAGLILLMLVIGGITRLTGSGLSMTDWNLILGTVPPMDHAEWMDAFSRYKQFPEYRQLNTGMTLAEFKSIYFWEYLHRLTGRLLGLVFLGPFLWFWYRGYFDRDQLKKLSLLFLLGAAQGAIGWIMVKSGLAELPYVSHYRLALHLVTAFLLFGFCVWLALEWGKQQQRPLPVTAGARGVSGLLYGIAALIMMQVVWGAFVAGLKAGHIYMSFPLMNGNFMPANAWALEPLLLNLVENPGLVQWVHRILGTMLLMGIFLLWIRTAKKNAAGSVRRAVLALLGLVVAQYALGILTLIYSVPVALGVAHQAVALLIFGAWIVLYRDMRQKNLTRNQTNLS